MYKHKRSMTKRKERRNEEMNTEIKQKAENEGRVNKGSDRLFYCRE